MGHSSFVLGRMTSDSQVFFPVFCIPFCTCCAKRIFVIHLHLFFYLKGFGNYLMNSKGVPNRQSAFTKSVKRIPDDNLFFVETLPLVSRKAITWAAFLEGEKKTSLNCFAHSLLALNYHKLRESGVLLG